MYADLFDLIFGWMLNVPMLVLSGYVPNGDLPTCSVSGPVPVNFLQTNDQWQVN